MAWCKQQLKFSSNQTASLVYHSKFDYLLTKEDLDKWAVGKKFPKQRYKLLANFKIPDFKNRIRREKISRTKLLLASKAASFLENIPTIKFVGITGSLAMNNAEEASDIDLMLITKNRTLWTTRGIVLVFLKLFGFKLRRAGQKEEKDKLCLNLWLDEGDLEWKDRNEFTAHEIVQIKPLINKNNTFEKFLFKNKWILDYWPNAVTISRFAGSDSADSSKFNFVRSVEKLAFQFQYLYMKRKITNEIVRLTRAQFHPRKIG